MDTATVLMHLLLYKNAMFQVTSFLGTFLGNLEPTPVIPIVENPAALIINKRIDEATMLAVIAEHFDGCDLCAVKLRSLKHATSHYGAEHGGIKGYLKCCKMKLDRLGLVVEHVRWHLNPMVFQ